MSELVINNRTYTQFKHVAEYKQSSVEVLAEEVIRQYLRAENRKIMQQEIVAYRHMHPQLLQNYGGQYVAIHQGQVVDHDPDELALYLRINKKYPETPILLRQVIAEVEETVTIRSPRFENV